MSDNVTISFGDDPGEQATLLLAAAEDLELGQQVVRTTGDGKFMVPAEVADKAGLEADSDEASDEGGSEEPKKTTAKKAAAKKAAEKE